MSKIKIVENSIKKKNMPNIPIFFIKHSKNKDRQTDSKTEIKKDNDPERQKYRYPKRNEV